MCCIHYCYKNDGRNYNVYKTWVCSKPKWVFSHKLSSLCHKGSYFMDSEVWENVLFLTVVLEIGKNVLHSRFSSAVVRGLSVPAPAHLSLHVSQLSLHVVVFPNFHVSSRKTENEDMTKESPWLEVACLVAVWNTNVRHEWQLNRAGVHQCDYIACVIYVRCEKEQ